jgi:hypothetical protein
VERIIGGGAWRGEEQRRPVLEMPMLCETGNGDFSLGDGWASRWCALRARLQGRWDG